MPDEPRRRTLDEILADLPRPDGRDDLRAAQDAHVRVIRVQIELRKAVHAREPDTGGMLAP